MRLSIIAGLLLSPSLLHAQAGTPSTSNLEARLATPTALVSAAPAAPAAASNTTAVVRVSTGVVPPQIVRSVPLAYPALGLDRAVAAQAQMVVKLTVNEKGEPENVTVANSVNPALDAEVVEAIRQYRFRPGTLDHQPIAVPVKLNVLFAQ